MKYFSNSSKTESAEQPIASSQQMEVRYHTEVVKPLSHKQRSLPIFHCEAGATCHLSDKASIRTLVTALDHLDPITRYNYTLIVSKGSIDNIADRTQDDLIRTCSTEKLCIIRNDVQKGTILKDLNRIGEGSKSVFFKYSPNINKTIKMI